MSTMVSHDKVTHRATRGGFLARKGRKMTIYFKKEGENTLQGYILVNTLYKQFNLLSIIQKDGCEASMTVHFSLGHFLLGGYSPFSKEDVVF